MADFGRLEAQSNRATFQRQFEIVDNDTDELLDLTGKAIIFEVKDPTECRALLSATIDNGKIAVVDLGTFIVTFARSEMTNLCPGTYDLGITIGDDDETGQALIGTLAIVAGVVAR
jgi:hypothetical protein